jgi:hypothetical protein
VEEIEYTTRLYRIHEAAHGIHLEAVPTEFHSLDSRYVFLLDGGLRRVPCSASSFNFSLCKSVVSSFFYLGLWDGFGKDPDPDFIGIGARFIFGTPRSGSVVGVQSQSYLGS